MKHGERRKVQILETGLRLWPNVSARGIGREIDLTHTAVLHHMGTAEALRDAVAAYAVMQRCKRVVPQLIVEKHPAATVLTAAERLEFLSNC